MTGSRGSMQEIKGPGHIYMEESMNEAGRFVKGGVKR
ncbi:MAG: hypothetical protein DID91_2727703029 [Candidatus Nitrotoga sp. MKT]|nr:MAG: hypothetical protein DID91_2727703029 [Candidatus Nitrotoga sp. MKT]